MIKSTSYNQIEILKNILSLHCNGDDIDCDPTYSKGVFYKSGEIKRPRLCFDLNPQNEFTVQADCRRLPLEDRSVNVLCFDPPFVISKGPSLNSKEDGRNMTHERFGSFESPKQLWDFYETSIKEFSRIIKDGGTLIFKCQDTVSGGKNYLSHVKIIFIAINNGFYAKDLFVLNSKNRLISGKVKNQQHARKFHSYFLVFKKENNKVNYF